MNQSQNKEVVYVRLDEIIPNRFQPRLTFNEQELNELAESIKLHGIIQPLVLRRVGDKYEIIAGERRYKASTIAGLKVVPALIVEMDDKESAEVALVENIQRKDLSAIEEAQSYKKILDMGYTTQEQLAARMGVSQSNIANKLRLLNLAIPVKEALLNNKISERHARSLLNITDPNMQIMMLNRIISERLTVRQADEEIAKLLGKNIASDIKPLDVDINNIKTNTTDVIQKQQPHDIDALLMPEEKTKESSPTPSPSAVTSFKETKTEPMKFDFALPESNNEPVLPTNSIIEEFRSQQNPHTQLETLNNYENPASTKNITKAINETRNQIHQIENMGFNVDTEEFDFEDSYQIIIKIKKD